MYFYIYKISSLIPEKPYYYIGYHRTKNLNDGYFGSGVKWTSVHRKYGKVNFKKEILGHYGSLEELLKVEKETIGNLFEIDRWCCNLCPGGLGVSMTLEAKKRFSERMKGEGNPNYGKRYSEEDKVKMGIRVSQEWKLGVRKGKPVSEEARENMRKAKKGTGKGELNPMFGRTKELNPFYGKSHSEETKRKLSEKAKLRPNPMTGKTQRRVQCEFCGTDTSISGYYQWHGEKCKLKI
jgi:hypothetical protein